MPAVRFRLHEDDHERYGADWYVYDESAVLRVPARELIEIERQIGVTVLTMLNRSRQDFADGNLAVMWVARRLAGVVEPFAEFTPLVMLAEWERLPAADVDPPAQPLSPSPVEG
ncbi:hypothetical protein ACPB67_02645 [Micromonospora taraxaci]|uniref:hypothetical protein n=1 Tax=Micromonospora taraxaci TaxID=1316803 RepID=UPI003C2AF27A